MSRELNKKEKEQYNELIKDAEQLTIEDISNKIYGYCRISTNKQSIERQIKNITKYNPQAKIIEEVFTGTKTYERKEFNKLLKRIKSGDTIIFDSVSRMSRNAEEGTKLYFELYDKGINLVFLKERHIDTDTYRNSIKNSISTTDDEIANIYIEATNKVIRLLAQKQIKQAFEQAQKEVDDLHQRTSEGVINAKANGKQVGRLKGTEVVTKKSIKAKKDIQKYSKDFQGTLKDVEVMKIIGITKKTYYKYKKELINELNNQ